MLHVSPQRARRNAGRPPEKDAPAFLKWLRGRGYCVFQNYGGCEGKIEAMHLDFAGGKGIASKVADKFSLPSCAGHHRRQHDRGWVTFLKDLGLTQEALLDAAARLWRSWPGRVAWERKMEDRA